ncbi:hypothetical protein [Oharaeibacter diazotrophicus]|uniref:hypothetical protein n=2 Tax=Oharaeibacter diazotrophicus TaxID=1920512 RepID=UPI001AADDC82|nr:hypothetical protein [Oharaeibacter diazotrophicus]
MRWTILAAVAGLLGWQVATRTLPAVLAPYDPGAALILAEGNPRALLLLAERRLGQDPTARNDADALPAAEREDVVEAAATMVARGIARPLLPPDVTAADRATVAALAAAAWRAAPLDPRAPRLLGQLSEDEGTGRRLMEQSVALSRHDPLALYWLIQHAFLAGDVDGVLRHADILLRAQPDFAATVAPMLTALTADEAIRPRIVAALAAAPPWRDGFLAELPALAADPRLPFALLRDLARGPTPPTSSQVMSYLTVLVAREDYRLAHEAWRVFPMDGEEHPADLVFDGGFRNRPGATPFSWAFSFGGGVRITTTAAPGRPGDKALALEFAGQMVEPMTVTQVTVLDPGRYRIAGSQAGTFESRRGLRWEMICRRPGAAPLGGSDELFGGGEGWSPFSFDIEIPRENCPVQILRLVFDTVAQADRIVRGDLYLTDISIRPLGGS